MNPETPVGIQFWTQEKVLVIGTFVSTWCYAEIRRVQQKERASLVMSGAPKAAGLHRHSPAA